jgi:hypothetical protein
MDVEIGTWSIEKEGTDSVRLTRGPERIHLKRDDNELAGERWFFDFEPSAGEPMSEQFRVETERELHAKVKTLVKNHS